MKRLPKAIFSLVLASILIFVVSKPAQAATTQLTKTFTIVPLAVKLKMVVTCNYHSTSDGYRFDSVSNVKSYLTGATLGMTWQQEYSSVKLLDGNRTISATVAGVIKMYLITETLKVLIYEDYETFHTEFYYNQIP